VALPLADCVRRGITSTRANWELALMLSARQILVTVLALTAVVLPLVALGASALLADLTDPRALERELPLLLARLRFSPALLAAAVASAAMLAAAWVVYSFVQAGTFGILLAADRQARPGPPREPLAFRTFSLQHFFGWGGRYLGRFFRFDLWALLLFLAPLLLTGLWIGFLAVSGQRWGGTALLGLGCGGFLPVAFLFAVWLLWMPIAQADLAREGAGVWRSTRRGLQVLGRRLGGVLGLFFLFVLAQLGLSLFFFVLSLALRWNAGDSLVTRGIVELSVALAQLLPSNLVTLAFGAALVALVRSEAEEIPVR
jgi:hypothetical protein